MFTFSPITFQLRRIILSILAGILSATVFINTIHATTPSPTASAKPTASPAAKTTTAKATPTPSPTSSPEPAATASSTTTEKLKERIERIVEEKSEKIKGVLSQLDVDTRGFIGQVQRVSENTVTVKTNKDTEILTVDTTTQIFKKDKLINVTDIAVDNWVMAVGVVEDDNFQLRRLVVSDTPLRPKTRLAHLGTIESITAKKIDFQPRGETTEVLTIDLTKNTKYQDLNGEDISSKDITADMQALVVGFQDDTTKTATLVRILAVVDTAAEKPTPTPTPKTTPVKKP